MLVTVLCDIIATFFIDKIFTLAESKSQTLQLKKLYSRFAEESEKTYEKEIEHYNNILKKYCDVIRKRNLNDIVLIIKLIKDLWKSIDGYYYDQESIYGYDRIALLINNRGNCIHLADDIIAKLNELNPEYNARKVYVCINKPFNYKYYLPIKRNKIENKKAELSEEACPNPNEIKHVVCAVDIPGKKVTLMVDPTNLIIGYFKKRKIKLFKTKKEYYRYIVKTNIMYSDKETCEFLKNYFSDIFRKFASSKEINKLYGIEAQKEALEYLEYVDEVNLVIDENIAKCKKNNI